MARRSYIDGMDKIELLSAWYMSAIRVYVLLIHVYVWSPRWMICVASGDVLVGGGGGGGGERRLSILAVWWWWWRYEREAPWLARAEIWIMMVGRLWILPPASKTPGKKERKNAATRGDPPPTKERQNDRIARLIFFGLFLSLSLSFSPRLRLRQTRLLCCCAVVLLLLLFADRPTDGPRLLHLFSVYVASSSSSYHPRMYVHIRTLLAFLSPFDLSLASSLSHISSNFKLIGESSRGSPFNEISSSFFPGNLFVHTTARTWLFTHSLTRHTHDDALWWLFSFLLRDVQAWAESFSSSSLPHWMASSCEVRKERRKKERKKESAFGSMGPVLNVYS